MCTSILWGPTLNGVSSSLGSFSAVNPGVAKHLYSNSCRTFAGHMRTEWRTINFSWHWMAQVLVCCKPRYHFVIRFSFVLISIPGNSSERWYPNENCFLKVWFPDSWFTKVQFGEDTLQRFDSWPLACPANQRSPAEQTSVKHFNKHRLMCGNLLRRL